MRKESIYAVYKGDKFIDLGTKKELAKKTGLSTETIRCLATPSKLKRFENSQKKSGYIAIKIEDED